ncbi:signal peptidase I (plasmid) [Paenibacillus thiaminolyticus]|uniref:signal peptidase I n=1 Tax=Paenibacillus thiaminolyticus TaxID=49283 RepID=UPI00232E9FDA|nr:signal peptidase I [Paenibacillus thiaminolyticus]WCF11752.1 signal peptidase I [Paenibacillus thiaminolyticus]
MQTEERGEFKEKAVDWTWGDLFDAEFKEKMKKKLSWFPRAIRISILLGVFLHFFAFGIVPSLSMYPTLDINDLVLYQRVDSFKRGDIVFFEHPNKKGEMYVKRIIGLPGDEVEIKHQAVYINGTKLEEEYVYEAPSYDYEVVVPKNSYFVLGDNRNNSEDSTNFGFVIHSSIKGKAIAVLLPIHRFGLLFLAVFVKFVVFYKRKINNI